MMERSTVRLSEVYQKDKPAISFELFPPKSWKGMARLFENFDELVSCGPAFVTCTYGAAGGSSGEGRTLEVLRLIRGDYPQVPLASHLTCVGRSAAQLRAYIEQAKDLGIMGIVALRGDLPGGKGPYEPVAGGYRYANELVAMIRAEFPELNVIVAGYPEKHPEAPSFGADIENLKRKVDAGADAVITQLFYNNDDFFRFQEACEKAHIDTPIIPGVLPVTSLAQIRRITDLCGARLTKKLLARLEAHGDDEEGQYSVGVYYATRQVEELVEQGVPGVHLYVLNKSRAAALICRALNLSQQVRPIRAKA